MKKKFLSCLFALALTSSFFAVNNSTNAEIYKDFTSDSKGKYLVNFDDSRVKNRWANVEAKWYYFDAEGYMVTSSWVGDYYLGKDGVMVTNTTTPDGYRVDENGKWIKEVLGDWKHDNYGWWYSKKDGSYPKNQWELISGKWYYFNSNGYMQTFWQLIDEDWYYLGSNGDMKTGWVKTKKDKWSYFKSSGEMLSNTIVKSSDDLGYIIDSDGYTLDKMPQGKKYIQNGIEYNLQFGNGAVCIVENAWIFDYSKNLELNILNFSDNVKPNEEVKVENIISNFKNYKDKYYIGKDGIKVSPTPEFNGVDLKIEKVNGKLVVVNSLNKLSNMLIGNYTIINNKLYYLDGNEIKTGYHALVGDGIVEHDYSFLTYSNENGEVVKVKRLLTYKGQKEFLNKEIDGFFGDKVIIESENAFSVKKVK